MKTNSKRFSIITILAVLLITCATLFGINYNKKGANTVNAASATPATGQVFTSDGTDTTVTEPYMLSSKGLSVNGTPKTWEAVIKLNEETTLSNGRWGCVISAYTKNSETGSALEIYENAKPRLFWDGFTGEGNVFDWKSSKSLPTGEWLHLVYIIDNVSTAGTTKVYLYVNGEQFDSATYTFTAKEIPANENYWIGADNRGDLAVTRFQGAIKFVGLSSSVKEESDVTTAYKNSQTWGDQDDYEFRDTVVGENAQDSLLYLRLPSKVNPYASYGYTGVDFSDGVNTYSAGSIGSTVPHTFEALIKTNSNLNDLSRTGVIIGSYNTSSSNNFDIEIHTNNQLRFYWRSGQVNWFTNYTVPVNEWVHIVFVRNGSGSGGTIECYVNGVLVDEHNSSSGDKNSSNGSGTETAVSDTLYIGRDSRTTACFQGLINYVGVSSDVKSATDIKNAYLSTTRLINASDSTTLISEQPMRAVYKAEDILPSTVNTFTATINVPSYNVQRGVIFGNYGLVGPYRNNYEITTGNKIRIYWQTTASGVAFDENIAGDYANLLACGEDRHIVITRNVRSGTYSTTNYGKFTLYIYDSSGTLLGGPYYTSNSSESETERVNVDILPKCLPTIGGDNRSQSVQYPFPGTIKSVAVYTDVLTQDEALEEAGYAASGTDITTTSAFGKAHGIMAHWELSTTQARLVYNETTRATANATVTDVSGNGHDATIKSVAQYIEIGNELIGTENNDANWFKADSDEYTFIYVPDTQTTVHWHADSITALQNWITTNADSMNLALVMGLGDIQDGSPSESTETTGDGDYCLNVTEQWKAMQAFYKALDDKGILWSAIMGNHDYDSNSPTATNGRQASKYNTYFGYSTLGDTAKSAIISRFAPDSSEENQNAIFEFTTQNGIKYLLVAFEFGPSDQMLEWASSVISKPEYANHRVLINTHSLVYATGEFNDENTTDYPEYYEWKSTPGININNGSQMWDEFISKHDNIFMCASGHIIYDEVMDRYDVGDYGNTVLSMLIDAQGTSYYNSGAYGVGGDGVIMVAKVNETDKTVTFRYYNPEANAFLMVENQFTYSFESKYGTTKQIVAVNEHLTVDKTYASSGTTVTVDVDGSFYSYFTPKFTTASGTVISYTAVDADTYTFTMPTERVYLDLEIIAFGEFANTADDYTSLTIKMSESKDIARLLPDGYTFTVSGDSLKLSEDGTTVTGVKEGTATVTFSNGSETVLTTVVTVTKEILVAPSVVDGFITSGKVDDFEVYEGARLRLMWTEYNCGIVFVGQIPTELAQAVQPKLLIVPQYYLDGIRTSTKKTEYEEARKYLAGGDYITALSVAGLSYKVVSPYMAEEGDVTLLLGGVKAIQDHNMNRKMIGIYFFEYYGTVYYAELPEGLEQNTARSMAYMVSGAVGSQYSTYEDNTYTGSTLDDWQKEITESLLNRSIADAISKYSKQTGVDYSSYFDTESITFGNENRVEQVVSFTSTDASATYLDDLLTYDLQISGKDSSGNEVSLNVGSLLDFRPIIQINSNGESYIEMDSFGRISIKSVSGSLVSGALNVGFAYQDKADKGLQTYAFNLEENANLVDLGVPTQYYEDANNQPSAYKPMANIVIKADGVKRLTDKTWTVIPTYGEQTSTQGTVTVNGGHIADTTLVTGEVSQTFKIASESDRIYTLTVEFKTKNGITLMENATVEVGPNNNYIYDETVTTTDGVVLKDLITAVCNGENNLSTNYATDYYWLEGQMTADQTVTVLFSEYDTWDGTRASSFASGSGTESDPYIIRTAEQLAYLAQISFDTDYGIGMYFELANSLDLDSRAWTPICFDAGTEYEWNWFKGNFNGNGYTIFNLNLDGTYYDASGTKGTKTYGYGLFGGIGTGGVVKNLTINGTANVSHRAGSVCYYLGNNAKVENVKNFANITTTDTNEQIYTGGIAGTCDTGNSYVINCVNYGTIMAQGGYVGGIVGSMAGGGAVIEDCINYGTVTAGFSFGGIAGALTQRVINCVNYGTIAVNTAISSVKVTSKNFEVKLTSSTTYSDQDVIFERYGVQVGGIIGYANGGFAIDCQNWGTVTGSTDCSHTWEFKDSALDESLYTLSDIPTNKGVGGIIGFNGRGGVENSVNNATVVGCSSHTGDSIGWYSYYLSGEDYAKDQVMINFKFVDEKGELFKYSNLAWERGNYFDGRNANGISKIAIKTLSYTVTNDDGTSYENTSKQKRGSLEELIDYVTEEINFAHGGYHVPNMFWWSGYVNGDTIIEIKFTEADHWDGSVASSFAGGSGTESDPYLISTGAQLAYLSSLCYDTSYGSGLYYKLINSIDLNDIAWTPIGWWSNSQYYGEANTGGIFEGNFDGNGYSIAGLNVENRYGNSSSVGLFGQFSGGTIKNLTVEGEVYGSNRVGGIAGRFVNSQVDNVYSYVDVYATGEGEGILSDGTYTRQDENTSNDTRDKQRYAGSLASMITNSSTVTNCAVYGNITATNGVERVGGAIGYCGTSTLINVANYGTVISAGPYVGGIIGNSSETRVYNCNNYGNVTCESYHVGGIIGETTNYTTIYNCYNGGDITGTDQVGGCLGYLGAGGTYNECSNGGTVSGTTSYVGDIVGCDNGVITGQTTTVNSATVNYYVITVNYFYEDGTVAHSPSIVAVKQNTYYGQDTVKLGVTDSSGNAIVETAENLLSPTIAGYLPDKFWVSGYADSDQTFNVTYSKADTWDGSVASSFAGGNGTKYNPYLIETAEQLALMSDMYNGVTANFGGNVYFKLVNSIDLNGLEWMPIGLKGDNTWRYFEGTFDGNGKTVANMLVSNGYAAGLFSNVAGTVKNLTVEGAVSGSTRVAGLCYYLGNSTKSGQLSGIKSFVTVTSTGSDSDGGCYVGGIFGTSRNAVVKDCENYGKVTAVGEDVGGICGQLYTNAYAENCINYGPINGANYYVAGLFGRISSSEAKNCVNYASVTNTGEGSTGGAVGQIINVSAVYNITNYGTVSATGHTVGGISGYVGAGSLIADSDNLSGATITSQNIHVAGIVGHNKGGLVRGCNNYAKVSSTSEKVGGIIGFSEYVWSGLINNFSNPVAVNCKNTGAVSGTSYVGGIWGYANSSDMISCTNTGGVSGTDNVGGIVGSCKGATVVQDCSNSGAVTATGSYVAGIAGFLGNLLCENIQKEVSSGVYAVNPRVGYCSQVINGSNSGTVTCNGTVVSKDYVGGTNQGWIYTLSGTTYTTIAINANETGTGTYYYLDTNSASTGSTTLTVGLRRARPTIYNSRWSGLLSTSDTEYSSVWTGEESYITDSVNGASVTITAKMVENVYIYGEQVSGVAIKAVITHKKAPWIELATANDVEDWYNYSSWSDFLNVEFRCSNVSSGTFQYFANSVFKNQSSLGVRSNYTYVKNSDGTYTSTFEMFIPYTKLQSSAGTYITEYPSSFNVKIGVCAESGWNWIDDNTSTTVETTYTVTASGIEKSS